MRFKLMFIAALLTVAVAAVQVCAQEEPVRVTEGLVVLYQFDEGDGDIVQDKSGVGVPLDLKINDFPSVSWLPGGGLEILMAGVALRPEQPATKIFDALHESNEFTIEADISPKDDTQEGPVRIVSFSLDPSSRNFTLGQSKTQYIMRLRTTETNTNGMPEAMTDENYVEAARQHVAVTYAQGRVRIYVDGELKHEAKRPGDLSNWDESYGFVIANENTLDRSFLGQLFLVAVYDRALTREEIEQNFAARARPLEAQAG